MKLAHLEVQPICIYLPDEEKWVRRFNDAKDYFSQQMIDNIMWVCGIHAEKFGVKASRAYDRDPQNIETGWTLEPRTVGNFLSWYMCWNIMFHHPEILYWMILEDDTRFRENWKQRAEQAIIDTPSDFDYLLLSHCCTDGRPTTHINGEVYEVKYPQAGHVAILAAKALPMVIEKCRNACYPMDVNLFDYVLPNLRTFTLLPRLADQVDTYMPD